MGNGRWSGSSDKSLGKSSGMISATSLRTNSATSSVWLRAPGAMVALLAVGSVLLGFGSRFSQKAVAALPASHRSAFSRPSLASMPSAVPSAKLKAQARSILGQLPLIFEPNQGQAGSGAKFLARGMGYTLFLDSTGAVLALPAGHATPPGKSAQQTEQIVTMKLVGSNPVAALTGADPLPGKSNYLIGNDPREWHRGVQQFSGVHYAEVYPGIDLAFYGNQGQLEYDFRVAPGSDPAQAELQFNGVKKLRLSGGDLILAGLTFDGKEEDGVRLQAPQIYQRDGDHRTPVAGRFVLRADNRVGFAIGAYDHSRELIIDPALSFSSYFGGSGSETSPSVAVNGDGSIYIAGTTTGSLETSFPVSGTQTLIGPLTLTAASPSHIFVARIVPTLPPSVTYETFIGGTGTDTSIGVAVDSSDNVYLVGNTSSTDFPINGTNVLGYQQAPEGKTECTASPTCTSIFVSVISGSTTIPGSTLNYSTYISGNGDDQASGMTIDANGDVFFTGTTTSDQNSQPATDAFPASHTPLAFQSSPLSTIAFFATELSTNRPNVGGIVYSTYFGGGTPTTPVAIGGGIAIDTTGIMYFSGTTNFYNSGTNPYGGSGQSEDFPILNAYQPCLDTPPPLTVPSNYTCSSTGFATPFPTDAFVAKLNPQAVSGAQLLFSTYLGGAATDTGAAIAVDSGAQNIYLTGETNSSNFVFPTGSTPYQLCLDTPPVTPPVTTCPVIATPAPFDAYVARLGNPTQSTTGVPNLVPLNYFTYLGGGGNDNGAAIAVLDSSSTTLDDAIVVGTTSSGAATGTASFPVTIPGAIQSQLLGPSNSFYAEIDTTTTVAQSEAGSYVTYFGGGGTDHGTGVAVDPKLNTYFVGDTNSGLGGTAALETENPVQAALAPGATRNAFVVKLGTEANLCITCVAPVLSVQTGLVGVGTAVSITYTVTNEGPDPSTNVIVTGSVPASGVIFNSATVGSGTCSAPSNEQVVCQIPALQSGGAAQVVFSVTPIIAGGFSATASVSSANNTSTNDTATASFTAGSYSLSISPPSRSVAAGGIAQFFVNLSPSLGGFPTPISLNCGAMPTGATCNFTSNSVTLSGSGPQSIQLNLLTTAQPQTTITAAPWHRAFYALWLAVPGMALLGVGAGGKRRAWKAGKKSLLLGLLGLLVLFPLVLLQPSCSTTRSQPQVSGTPSGTYQLTVTATSGTFTLTQQFSLSVVP